MKIKLFDFKSKDKENTVHVYSIGKNKVTNNQKNKELINKTIAETSRKLKSMGYY